MATKRVNRPDVSKRNKENALNPNKVMRVWYYLECEYYGEWKEPSLEEISDTFPKHINKLAGEDEKFYGMLDIDEATAHFINAERKQIARSNKKKIPKDISRETITAIRIKNYDPNGIKLSFIEDAAVNQAENVPRSDNFTPQK
jgi:hypothetical protein